MVPTGEMPRSFSVTCDRYLTDKVTPGNRVKIVGILSILNRGSGDTNTNANKQIKQHVKTSYIRVLGLQSELNQNGVNTTGFAMPNITQEDEEKIT